jgi:hypothetical protein
MTPEQALSILDQMCQPGVAFKRMDYVFANQALQVLKALVDAQPKPADGTKVPSG